MRIAGTHYNLNHKALEIFISGCNPPHCNGCHNSELWDFNWGCTWDSEYLSKTLYKKLQNTMIEKVWIMGGEPLDQDLIELGNFMALLYHWRTFQPTEFWLWTKYEVVSKKVCKYFTHAKLGSYQKNLPSYIDEKYGVELASENQKIIILDK